MKNKTLQLFLVFILIIVLIVAGILFAMNKLLGFDAIAALSEKISPPQQEEPAETTPPDIRFDGIERITLQPKVAVTLYSNEEISLDPESESKFKLHFYKLIDNEYIYILEALNVGIGEAKVKPVVKDSAGNKLELGITIKRENYPLPLGLKNIDDWQGFSYVSNANDPVTPVDKLHKLSDDYYPEDLVDLNKDKLLYTNATGIKLRSEAADYLAIMLKKLQDDTGKIVVIASGYRSFNDQLRQYSSWVRQLGQGEADKISARPGFSEHQLGTVVDFMSQDSGFDFTNAFDDTVSGQWLRENAHLYGYVQSYPAGKEDITGYNHEAWHYRYIGVENAKLFKESGLTLREWLGK